MMRIFCLTQSTLCVQAVVEYSDYTNKSAQECVYEHGR
jgi:hypothetical protein